MIMVMTGAKIFIEIGDLSISIKNGKFGSLRAIKGHFGPMELFGKVRLKGIGSVSQRKKAISHIHIKIWK